MLERAIDAIVNLNAAFTNIRLYPPTSAIITKSIDSVCSILQGIFEQEETVDFAESEGSLTISGRKLNEKDNKRPQVISFIQLMLRHGIRNIVFKKGLGKGETINFLGVLNFKPEDLRKEGGIQKVMSEKEIKNIVVNQGQEVAPAGEQGAKYPGDVTKTETNKAPDREHLQHIKEGIESIIKGEERAFRDRLVMQALPRTVSDLMAHGKEKTADVILQRLGNGLLNENVAVRGEASLTFARIGAKLISERRMAEMIKHSLKLVKWIRLETVMLPAYKHISNQLLLISRYLIMNRRFAEAAVILKPFRMISTGELNKEESIKTFSEAALREMAKEDILALLSNVFQTDRNGPGDQARELLVILGSGSSGEPERKAVSPAEVEMAESKQGQAEDEFAGRMSLIDDYVKNKDTDGASKLLFEMIVRYSAEKDFEKAEGLRDKLMDVNPMALSEIIKSGEIIEEAKTKAIDQAHLTLWARLYNNLTKEETSTLFFAMKSIRFDAGYTIFKKGDHDSRLYFINKGRIKLVLKQGDQEVIAKELKQGDMLGEDAFFSLSLSTITAITLSPVELSYLEKDVLAKWELKSYGIEPKLHDYYLRIKRVENSNGAKISEKRVHGRISVTGKIRVQFMDAAGYPAGEPVTGAISDISQGGMSFYINIKKEKITKLFIEPRLNVKFSLVVNGAQHGFDQNGTMVAAIPHYYDYSIHVKFDERLDKQVIDGLRKTNDSGEGDLDLLIES